MTQSRTTEVTVDGQAYQLRKMLPSIGGYIWQMLAAAIVRAQSELKTTDKAEEMEGRQQGTPEERTRALCGIAFMFMPFKDYEFVQTEAMKVTSRVESVGPMPVMSSGGKWAISEVQDDPMLVTKLMVEALVFNLCPFLAVKTE